MEDKFKFKDGSFEKELSDIFIKKIDEKVFINLQPTTIMDSLYYNSFVSDNFRKLWIHLKNENNNKGFLINDGHLLKIDDFIELSVLFKEIINKYFSYKDEIKQLKIDYLQKENLNKYEIYNQEIIKNIVVDLEEKISNGVTHNFYSENIENKFKNKVKDIYKKYFINKES